MVLRFLMKHCFTADTVVTSRHTRRHKTHHTGALVASLSASVGLRTPTRRSARRAGGVTVVPRKTFKAMQSADADAAPRLREMAKSRRRRLEA